MKFITQEAIDKAVLFQFFLHAQSSAQRLKKEEIATRFSIEISPKRVELALDNLEAAGSISRWSTNDSCSIENPGYKIVEQALATPDSFFRLYADGGDGWLQNQTIGLDGIPASDRIVSKSDNQLVIQQVDKILDDIGEQLTSNNEIGAALGDQKDYLISEIEASKVLTKSTAFRLSRLISLLAPALKYLSEKFSGAAIGEAAKHLMKLLFGLM